MKKLLTASAITALMAGVASAEEVKLGVLIGFTGPIESLTPAMNAAAEMAAKEVSDSGKLLGGATVVTLKGDTTCAIDTAAATAAAEKLITTDKVNGIIGGDCSGVTGAILQNVARPNGMVMVSPSATSPALSTAEDDGLFFRTAPSDAREGEVMADILTEKGIKSIALTYTNNDYGKGLAESIAKSFEAKGGKVTINVPHDDGKADYSAEVAALASAGGDILVVAGYLDQGGKGIIQASLDSGAFSTFGLPGGMIGDSLPTAIGPGLDGSFGQIAGSDSVGAKTFEEMMKAISMDGTSAYSPESYDAAALILLAMQAAKSSDPKVYKEKIMEIANGPGEKIYPGELAKGLELLAAGTAIDYEGATAVTLVGPGESAGRYREIVVKDGKNETVGFR
ncbi:ABC transporter substrate-binding protein [Tabrizicola sp. J26]|uniref:ABC transporter substrate-binding protein n=1 Tax=Alitabrizicola rongguiensis TaxID=2909234 RepID=UPI001F3168F5|nr:ABC transporter substrate-binding protein [Tabrizicola rongguiensis]MCF1709884.1 ABC transporter substrate-binding protein [Tabrizicola rongguiensis]